MSSSVSFKGAALLFVVVFAGVFSALWLEAYLQRQSAVATVRSEGVSLQPAGLIDRAPFDFSEASRRVIPSVVSIDTQIERDSFLGERRLQAANTGSGVVIQADGYIVTNAHVVRDPNFRGRVRPVDVVSVRTSDGRGYSATVVGIDELSDLAVIKVEADNLVPADFGNSDKIQIGEWALAVGNQLGFDNTVSVGVVSSKNRWNYTTDDSILIDAIQTDASINRGNSGGALCNSQGEVIGINSTIAVTSSDRLSVGVGFAIPSNHVRRVVADLMEFGFVRYAILGVELATASISLAIPEDRSLIAQLSGAPDPPSYGVVVMASERSLPAGEAGIRPYDVIMEIDGRRMYGNMDYVKTMIAKSPGDEVDIKVWSAGETKEIMVTLTAREP